MFTDGFEAERFKMKTVFEKSQILKVLDKSERPTCEGCAAIIVKVAGTTTMPSCPVNALFFNLRKIGFDEKDVCVGNPITVSELLELYYDISPIEGKDLKT